MGTDIARDALRTLHALSLLSEVSQQAKANFPKSGFAARVRCDVEAR